MNKSRAAGRAAVFLLIVLAVAASSAPSHAQTSAQADAQIGQAYAAILSAQQSGGNVTALVAKLNSAIALYQQAELVNATDPSRASSLSSQASVLVQQVISGAPAVAAAGKASVAAAQLDLAVETVVLGALAVVTYLYLPRAYWRVWLRVHRGWRVKRP